MRRGRAEGAPLATVQENDAQFRFIVAMVLGAGNDGPRPLIRGRKFGRVKRASTPTHLFWPALRSRIAYSCAECGLACLPNICVRTDAGIKFVTAAKNLLCHPVTT